MTHLAALMQGEEGLSDFISIHQWIGAVNQQQVKIIGRQIGEGLLCTADNMVAVGDVVADRMLRFGRGGDATFGDDLHPLTQRGRELHRLAEGGFTLITTVDIGMVDGSDPQLKMFFNKAGQLLGGHIPVHQTPVTHHKTGKLRALRGKGNTLNHSNFLKKSLGRVYAFTALKK
ncbi:hypothetical protein D3C76_1062670 [compost metagenome]